MAQLEGWFEDTFRTADERADAEGSKTAARRYADAQMACIRMLTYYQGRRRNLTDDQYRRFLQSARRHGKLTTASYGKVDFTARNDGLVGALDKYRRMILENNAADVAAAQREFFDRTEAELAAIRAARVSARGSRRGTE